MHSWAVVEFYFLFLFFCRFAEIMEHCGDLYPEDDHANLNQYPFPSDFHDFSTKGMHSFLPRFSFCDTCAKSPLEENGGPDQFFSKGFSLPLLIPVSRQNCMVPSAFFNQRDGIIAVTRHYLLALALSLRLMTSQKAVQRMKIVRKGVWMFPPQSVWKAFGGSAKLPINIWSFPLIFSMRFYLPEHLFCVVTTEAKNIPNCISTEVRTEAACWPVIVPSSLCVGPKKKGLSGFSL